MHTQSTALLRILVVDDDADTAWSIATALKSSLRCTVGIADDGAQAIDKAIEMRPDVILMDIAMPGVDGIEAAALLRSLFSTREMPRLLAVSGQCGWSSQRVLLQGGFDAFLQKPVGLEALLRALGDHAAAA